MPIQSTAHKTIGLSAPVKIMPRARKPNSPCPVHRSYARKEPMGGVASMSPFDAPAFPSSRVLLHIPPSKLENQAFQLPPFCFPHRTTGDVPTADTRGAK